MGAGAVASSHPLRFGGVSPAESHIAYLASVDLGPPRGVDKSRPLAQASKIGPV